MKASCGGWGGGVVDRHQSKYIKTFNLEKLRVHLLFISGE